jgi:hypothetical protein
VLRFQGLKVKISRTKGWAPSGGGSGGSGGQAGSGGGTTYDAINNAWKSKDTGWMSSNNPNYEFEWAPEGDKKWGYKIYPKKWDSETASYVRASEKPLQKVTRADQLARYFYKTYKGSTPEQQFWAEQAQSQGGGSSSNSSGESMSGF